MKQSGTSLTRFINIDEDVAIVEATKAFAVELVQQDLPTALAHQQRWVGMSADYLRS